MIQNISTVEQTDYGWLVNGSMFVPNSPDNIDYNLVHDWIAKGGKVTIKMKTRREIIGEIERVKNEKRDASFILYGVMWDNDRNARSEYTQLQTEISLNSYVERVWKTHGTTFVNLTKEIALDVIAESTKQVQDSFIWMQSEIERLNNTPDEELNSFEVRK